MFVKFMAGCEKVTEWRESMRGYPMRLHFNPKELVASLNNSLNFPECVLIGRASDEKGYGRNRLFCIASNRLNQKIRSQSYITFSDDRSVK